MTVASPSSSTEPRRIRRALLSVSNPTGLAELAWALLVAVPLTVVG